MRLEAGEGVLRRGESPVVPLVSVTRMVKICSCNLPRGEGLPATIRGIVTRRLTPIAAWVIFEPFTGEAGMEPG